VLLLSFAIFLPLSLFYRRWIRNTLPPAAPIDHFRDQRPSSAFYDAYQNSPNGRQLDFVDLSNSAWVSQSPVKARRWSKGNLKQTE
jgi:hypothetical protein